ncbi:molybdopterin molybdotransferase MoeA [Parablastomonas sp. CN1-191]|uniref:molybdopterin molybdotransferase MoeA n=1 Tax=Parablastomonas sp. CN1-191 TaxID=3400908 RepID=UPI003BF88BC0
MTLPLPLEAAQARLLGLARPVDVVTVPVREALGHWLARPLLARQNRPALPTSSMDGYAVVSTDMAGPWTVIGESAAGRPFSGIVAPGQAVRIATGASMPQGTDAVIVQEDVSRDVDTLTLHGSGPSRPGFYVRVPGTDFRVDDVLLPAGTRIAPTGIALALSAGRGELSVHRPVRIAVIDCGAELVANPASCAGDQVPASNGAMLAAMLSGLPVHASTFGPIADRVEAFVAALDRCEDADLIVTSGGASVGDHDVTRPALEWWGATLDFWRVAIKPGKPLLVAARGEQIVLGLPGNPVSAYVTAYLFLLPLVRAMSGSTAPLPHAELHPLAAAMGPGGDRRELLRGAFTADGVAALPRQDSADLRTLAGATVLIDRPALAGALPAGTFVPVYRTENGGIA